MKKTSINANQEYSMLMEIVHWFHICVMGIHKFRQTVNESCNICVMGIHKFRQTVNENCNFYRNCESHNMKH